MHRYSRVLVFVFIISFDFQLDSYVGGVIRNDLLDKPWVQVSPLAFWCFLNGVKLEDV